MPTGTVSFLFTDVEGSTQLWEQRPREMATAMSRHDQIVRSAVAEHRGHVFSTSGDGFGAAFWTPWEALEAAIGVQELLAAEPWPAPLTVAVRMAIHTGSANERDGDYFGPTVNRAARLMAAGHGGQILLSGITAQLVNYDDLVDLGEQRLKDLAAPERVFQAGQRSFPPLRSLDTFGHNLPTRLTSLIGREADTAAVLAAMGDSRLVTLIGTGGVGKTRLGLQVAAESVDRFDGGVWWVELATVSEPNSLPGAVLDAIGLLALPGRRPVHVVRDHVGDRSMLLVLDNCEHVIAAAAAFVNEVLSTLPAARVLATSREPLSVPGETVWRVPSLTLPDQSRRQTVDSIGCADAARLFLDRARLARPDLTLNDEGADAITRICHRLDGIPLSIELAAARCRNFSVEQIARELDDRFRLLTGGARTVLERQQTLKASIDWSHDLLDTGERVALRRLGVFSGPFTVGAAQAVVASVGDIDRYDVFDLVDRLADKSMIAVEHVDPAGESRYRLLETIRYYALDRLNDADELVAARDAHTDYWAGWAEHHNVHFDCSITIYSAIPADLANLTAAARWACVNRPELLQALMLCIGPFLQLEDSEHGAGGLFNSALAALDGRDDIAWAHVATAAELARLYTWLVVPDDELRVRAEELARTHDLVLVRAHLELLAAEASTMEPERFAVAGELFDLAGSPSWGSLARAGGARYLAASGRLDAADQLLAAARHASNHLTLAAAVGATAQVALVRGELSGVAHRTREELTGLPSPSTSRLHMFTNVAYETVARVAFFSGDRDVLAWAATTIREGAKTYLARRIAAVPAAHVRVSEAASPDSAPPGSTARTLIESSVRDRPPVGSASGGGLLRRETPYLAIAAADPDWIATERTVIEHYTTENDPRARCAVSLLDGVLALLHGEAIDASQHWHDLLALSSEHGFGLLWIDALEGLAICAARAGADDMAARLACAAEAARNQRGYRYRYPHLAELPSGSDEGRALSLEEATAYARRSRGERVRPVSGWAALTPTEIEVARAVADGLTNQQAAARLFISVPTVKTHLRHIFAKLGIDNRSQLVAEVAQHKR
jgi:predicted ATPase/class 3 adenylate cyclase/DNA-binding CsgD family transcriptional regulator